MLVDRIGVVNINIPNKMAIIDNIIRVGSMKAISSVQRMQVRVIVGREEAKKIFKPIYENGLEAKAVGIDMVDDMALRGLGRRIEHLSRRVISSSGKSFDA